MNIQIVDARYLEPSEINVMLNSNDEQYAMLEFGSLYSNDLVAFQEGLPQSAWYQQKALFDQYLLDYAQWEIDYLEWQEDGSDPETEPPQPAPVAPQDPIDPDDIEPGVISPYDKYFGWDDEQAHKAKYSEAEKTANDRINYAYMTPWEGERVDPEANKIETAARRTAIADKLAGGTPLTDDEKLQARADNILSNYVLAINGNLKGIHEVIYAIVGIDEIMDYDVNSYPWAVWTPPIRPTI